MVNIPIVVKVKKLHKLAMVPTYLTPGSVGCDVYACDAAEIGPGKRCLINTGISIEIPEGYECQVRPRSGLALKHGVTVLNSPGTIDVDYRDEVKVLLYNTSSTTFIVEPGMRVAQLVFAPVIKAKFEEVEKLFGFDRRGGFGSTGLCHSLTCKKDRHLLELHPVNE